MKLLRDATGRKLYPVSRSYWTPRKKGAPATMAINTGEKRPPKKGEYFLSGAHPAAYQAPNDLSQPYWIARLVKVETRTTHHIVKETRETYHIKPV